MMDWLKQTFASAQSSMRSEVMRFKNRDFMHAVVAGCAVVAAADGKIDSSEKQTMVGYLRVSDELKVFDLDEVTVFFGDVTKKFEFDYDIGVDEAVKYVRKLRDNPDAARTMIRVCCKIGASDGNFDADEKKSVARLCRELNLDPKEFQLT
jgi:tellurite resistance protein TerB